MPNKRLALLGLEDGQLLALDAITGRWVGGDSAQTANGIATMRDATPDKGEPAVWVAKEVQKKLGGELQILVQPPDDEKGTIH